MSDPKSRGSIMNTVFCVLLFLTSSWALPHQIPFIQPQDHSQGYDFNPLFHLPGISRYFDAVGFGLRHTPPDGCKVTAASYLIRHSAIYANEAEYDEFLKPFIFKVEKYRGGFSGPLEFLNQWQNPIIEDKLEDITPHGLKDAYSIGEHLSNRYPDLVPTAKKILSDKKARCYDTANAFVQAFPNHDGIEISRFKKPQNGSMNPIIPHKSCQNFSKEPGRAEMATFLHTYAQHTSARFDDYTPFTLSDNDILAMQSICGYESAITGTTSQLCTIFTDAEWMAYEYAWDLRYAHMIGPLNPLSHYLGFPWLQAQSNIFQTIDLPENTNTAYDMNGLIIPPWSAQVGDNTTFAPSQRFFLSFTHREVPPLIATALGIFNSSFEAKGQFPTDRVVWTRAWKMADLIPFLGHVGLEKMTCEASSSHPREGGEFVRVIANAAPRPIPPCQSGPGASCPLEEFGRIIGGGHEEFKEWREVCGMEDEE